MSLSHLNAQNNGQWEILNEGVINIFFTSSPIIQFATEEIGWIADANSLLKTSDGGKNWSSLTLNENWNLREFEFLNDSIGYAYGTSDSIEGTNYIMKSIDGGISWIPVYNLPENYLFTDISFVSDSVVYAIGYNTQSESYYGWVMKSGDGGVTWEEVSPSPPLPIHKIHFYNSNTGFIVGHSLVGNTYDGFRILRTNDGGMSWVKQEFDQFDKILELQVVNDSLIYFTAYHDNNDNKYYLCRSVDTLKNWQVIQFSDYNIGPFYSLNENNFFSFFRDSIDNYLMKSVDGGINWGIIKKVEGGPAAIHFTPGQTGYYLDNIDLDKRAGRYGIPMTHFLYKSDDNGNTWYVDNYNYPLTDVFFLDQFTGFATGGGEVYGALHARSHFGRLFKTNDSGTNWDFMPQVENGIYVQCEFFNREVGLIRTRDRILKTTDDGNTWIEIYVNNIDSTGFEFIIDDISCW
jgi:photosystem II stability/assembly factor-like uncharacterized protein